MLENSTKITTNILQIYKQLYASPKLPFFAQHKYVLLAQNYAWTIAKYETLNGQFKEMLVKQGKNKKYNWISNKKYVKWKMVDFLANVAQTSIIKFQANKNYQRSILKHIEHIHFTDLQYLSLEQNWITNIEALVYIDAPQLRFINLRNNQITEMRVLRKINFPKLRSFKVNTHQYFTIFNQMGNYNRHSFLIAKELIRNHTQSVFSERIKKILSSRRQFYMSEKERQQVRSEEDSTD